MKTIILTLAIIAILFVQVGNVKADSFNPGSKVNTHIQIKHDPSCTKKNMPVLGYYTQPELDGQQQDFESAYQDYLEDFAHWLSITDNPCN